MIRFGKYEDELEPGFELKDKRRTSSVSDRRGYELLPRYYGKKPSILQVRCIMEEARVSN